MAVVGNDDRDKDDEPIITRTGPTRFSPVGEENGARLDSSGPKEGEGARDFFAPFSALLSFRYSSLPGEGENCYCPPRCKITAPIKQRPTIDQQSHRVSTPPLDPRSAITILLSRQCVRGRNIDRPRAVFSSFLSFFLLFLGNATPLKFNVAAIVARWSRFVIKSITEAE